jgi:NADH-quinone oxidoreductase subunit N
MFLLAIVGIIASIISAFYSLRIVKVIYFDESSDKFDGYNSKSLNILFIPSTAIMILFFIYPAPIISVASFASKTFF